MSSLPPGTGPIRHAAPGTTIEQLLTPTGPPVDGMVQLGSLRVEAGIFEDFQRAERYLARSAEARDTLDALVHGNGTIDVRRAPLGGNEFSERSSDGVPTIHWSPRQALHNADGTTHTPALGLLHEQGHAARFLADPAAYNAGNVDREERRNTLGLENRVARELGEGTRDEHSGDPYLSPGPTSAQVEPPRERIAFRIGELAAAGRSVPPIAAESVAAVTNADGRPHAGTFVDIGDGQMALGTGRGRYIVYDIDNDLNGVRPAEGQRVEVDALGRTWGVAERVSTPPAQTHER